MVSARRGPPPGPRLRRSKNLRRARRARTRHTCHSTVKNAPSNPPRTPREIQCRLGRGESATVAGPAHRLDSQVGTPI
eukprot:6392984-Alexandrium_andersonii.AAC.1